MSEYFPPEYGNMGFHCPYCHVYADQTWGEATWREESIDESDDYAENIRIEEVDMKVSVCSHCENSTFWLAEKIIYPPIHASPPANSDLPDDVQGIYKEAAAIANQSPRAASALLRVAIEMLLKDLGHLGEKDDINNSIGNLVNAGLDESIQKSLDALRVVGNNAVHPGQIDFNDSTDVLTLFELINFIADDLITRRKKIDAMYSRLPETAREGIKKRDERTE